MFCSVPELSEREPEVLGEVLPEQLDRRHPHEQHAGHEAHLHRHQAPLPPPIGNARQKVKRHNKRRKVEKTLKMSKKRRKLSNI